MFILCISVLGLQPSLMNFIDCLRSNKILSIIVNLKYCPLSSSDGANINQRLNLYLLSDSESRIRKINLKKKL